MRGGLVVSAALAGVCLASCGNYDVASLTFVDVNPAQPKIGDVTTVGGARVVYLGSFQECTIDEAEFVQQGTKIYKLERQPRYGAQRIQACECHFAGYRCGGAVPPRVALYYELPADTTYEGAMAVGYDAQDPSIQNARTDCRPPPPPP